MRQEDVKLIWLESSVLKGIEIFLLLHPDKVITMGIQGNKLYRPMYMWCVCVWVSVKSVCEWGESESYDAACLFVTGPLETNNSLYLYPICLECILNAFRHVHIIIFIVYELTKGTQSFALRISAAFSSICKTESEHSLSEHTPNKHCSSGGLSKSWPSIANNRHLTIIAWYHYEEHFATAITNSTALESSESKKATEV